MASDIFVQLSQIFRKEPVEGEVNVFVLHRFLASDPAYAPVAKELARLYQDDMVVEIWKSSLPRSPRAPFFRYTGPKKMAASGELVKKVAEVEGYTLMRAEEVVQLIDAMGNHEAALTYYGVEL